MNFAQTSRSSNVHRSICTLPTDMINGRTYLILFMWTMIVSGVAVWFTPIWMYRLLFASRCQKKRLGFLEILLDTVGPILNGDGKLVKCEEVENRSNELLWKFLKEMGLDGYFMIQMMKRNVMML
ncbi:hypothetical protein ACTXT7_016952 [Hymenolepis weldensis]